MKNFHLAKEEWRREKTDMTVKILKEVNVELEKYYTIRAIVINARGVKQCMAEVSTSEKPTEQQIGEFLYTTGADFCSVVENYRFKETDDSGAGGERR